MVATVLRIDGATVDLRVRNTTAGGANDFSDTRAFAYLLLEDGLPRDEPPEPDLPRDVPAHVESVEIIDRRNEVAGDWPELDRLIAKDEGLDCDGFIARARSLGSARQREDELCRRLHHVVMRVRATDASWLDGLREGQVIRSTAYDAWRDDPLGRASVSRPPLSAITRALDFADYAGAARFVEQVDPNATTVRGWRLLTHALQSPFKKPASAKRSLVEALLAKGADPNGVASHCCQAGCLPLLRAASRDRDLIAPLLEAGADLLGRDPHGGVSVFLGAAWTGGHAKEARELVERCLEAGAEPDDADEAGNTALHMCGVDLSPNASLIRVLLEAGAPVDRPNAVGVTPIMRAARLHDAKAVKRLLRHRPRLDARDHRGWTVLHHAAAHRPHRDEREVEVLKLLRSKSGLEPNVADSEGNTPLHVAVRQGSPHVVSWLMAQGADPDRPNDAGEPARAPSECSAQ